jgi:hypothetical protein
MTLGALNFGSSIRECIKLLGEGDPVAWAVFIISLLILAILIWKYPRGGWGNRKKT